MCLVHVYCALAYFAQKKKKKKKKGGENAENIVKSYWDTIHFIFFEVLFFLS